MFRYWGVFIFVVMFLVAPAHSEETAILWPSDSNEDDEFGYSVAVSGDTVVVGSPGGSWTSGSAFVFMRNEGGAEAWGEVAKLTAADAAAGDRFGVAVAIDGDTIVVGAPFEDTGGPSWGSAYVFERDAGGVGAWGQVAKLNTATRGIRDHFGESVAISGDTIIVGSPAEDGVGEDSGAAYVFERDLGGADSWGLATQLIAGESFGGDVFGSAVSIDGDLIAVGAPEAFLISCDCKAGAVWLYERDAGDPTIWLEAKKFENQVGDWYNSFGEAVAVSGASLLIGDPRLRPDSGPVGGVYFFDRDQGGADQWGLVKLSMLSDIGIESSQYYGESVALSGDVAVVGHASEDEAFYVQMRSPGVWGINGGWRPSEYGNSYGWDVAVSGTTVVVGAPQDSVGGSQSGTAYVIEVVADEFEELFVDGFESGSLGLWSNVVPG